MTSFPVLKNHTEVLNGVYPYLSQSFQKLRQFDEQACQLQSLMESKCAQEIEDAIRRKTSGEAVSTSTLQSDFKLLEEVSHRKAELAYEIYDHLDKIIQRLDTDINALGNEIDLERETFGLPHMVPPEPPKAAVEYDADGDPDAAAAAAAAAAEIGAHVDPNEPLYCYCQRVSFGEMVACENRDCPIEWFHYACVGLRPGEKIKGKWYCPECRPQMPQKVRETRLGAGRR